MNESLCLASLAILSAPAGAQTLAFEVPHAGRLAPTADLNDDGTSDLRIGFQVVSGADGAYLLDTTAPSPGPPWEASGWPIGDLTGDGVPDVAFLLADTSSTAPPVFVYSGVDGFPYGTGRPAPPYGSGCDSIRWVDGDHDVDGDGVDDVVYGSYLFCFGESAHGYLSGASFGVGINSSGELLLGDAGLRAVFGDLDGDGVEDVVFDLFEERSDVHHYEAYAFSLAPSGLFDIDDENTVVGAADVDGDGRQDLLTLADGGAPPGPVVALSAVDQTPVLTIPGSFEAAWGAGDVDCDGLEDILTASPDGQVRLVSSATGSVVWQTSFDADRFVRLPDVNGDGLADWALGSSVLGKTRVYAAPGPPMTSYCTGKANSQGCVPVTGTSGLPTTQGPDDFVVTAREVLLAKPGLFFWGTTGRTALPFLGGTLCVQPPLQRGPVLLATGPSDCLAGYVFPFTQTFALQAGIAPGTQINGQFWMRDPAHPDGSGVALSDGIEFPWCE